MAKANIGTTETTIVSDDAVSGCDVGSIHINNSTTDSIIAYLSIVSGAETMSGENSILWNTPVESGGYVSICQPLFLASGEKIVASGSATGLNARISYLRYNV